MVDDLLQALHFKDEEQVNIDGKHYLPRKFKIALAIPPSNDVDLFANDLGFIAIAEDDRLPGFNVTVGGGLSMTHGEENTYPRLADVIGYCPKNKTLQVAEEIVKIQCDFGDRTNRKHARFKYTIDDRGVDWLKFELNKRLGWSIEPPVLLPLSAPETATDGSRALMTPGITRCLSKMDASSTPKSIR
ncbi:MAG: hypothetical protein WC856_26900 [Methylococcaceae bacterium]